MKFDFSRAVSVLTAVCMSVCFASPFTAAAGDLKMLRCDTAETVQSADEDNESGDYDYRGTLFISCAENKWKYNTGDRPDPDGFKLAVGIKDTDGSYRYRMTAFGTEGCLYSDCYTIDISEVDMSTPGNYRVYVNTHGDRIIPVFTEAVYTNDGTLYIAEGTYNILLEENSFFTTVTVADEGEEEGSVPAVTTTAVTGSGNGETTTTVTVLDEETGSDTTAAATATETTVKTTRPTTAMTTKTTTKTTGKTTTTTKCTQQTGGITGDLNNDKRVNVADLVFLQKMLNSNSAYSRYADINRDGTVNVFDMILLKRIILGL